MRVLRLSETVTFHRQYLCILTAFLFLSCFIQRPVCASMQATAVVRNYAQQTGSSFATAHAQWYNGLNPREATGSVVVNAASVYAHSVIDMTTYPGAGGGFPCDQAIVDMSGQFSDTLMVNGGKNAMITAQVSWSDTRPGYITYCSGNIGPITYGTGDYQGPNRTITYSVTNGRLAYGGYLAATGSGAGNKEGTFHIEDSAQLTIQFSSPTSGVQVKPKSQLTKEDVFSGSFRGLDAYRNATVDNPYAGPMRFDFVPNYNLTLQEAASMFGYDHFNFLQLVTLPASWQAVWCMSDPPYTEIGPAPARYYDPFPGTYGQYGLRFRRPDGSVAYGPVVVEEGMRDDKEFYFSEAACDPLNPPVGHVVWATNTNTSTIAFRDAPAMDPGSYAPGEFTQFDTMLAGVRSDGAYEILPGTNLRWKSNAERGGSGGTFLFAVVDDGALSPIVSGGVFDVELVPEPCSPLVLGVGLLSLAACRRRHATRRTTTDPDSSHLRK